MINENDMYYASLLDTRRWKPAWAYNRVEQDINNFDLDHLRNLLSFLTVNATDYRRRYAVMKYSKGSYLEFDATVYNRDTVSDYDWMRSKTLYKAIKSEIENRERRGVELMASPHLIISLMGVSNEHVLLRVSNFTDGTYQTIELPR